MKSEKFETFTAIMIAIVTIVSAVVAWRAAVASQEANQADFTGLTAAIHAEEAQVLNNITVAEHRQAFLTYTRYNELGYELYNAANGANANAANELTRQKSEAWGIAAGLQSIFFPSRYLRPDGTYDAQREMDEKNADAARTNDIHPEPHFNKANSLRLKANLMVAALIFLGIALWMFTCAQIIGRRIRYVFAVGGSLLLLAAIFSATLIELLL